MVIRQTNVTDVVTADVLGQQGIATLRQVVAAQEQTARLVAVGATAAPIASITLPGVEPTDPDAPRKLRAFDVLPVPGADYYREEVILRGTAGIADAVYVCLQIGDDSYTWRLVAGGGPDIGLYTSMVLDDAVTGPLIFLRSIKTGMITGNTEAALRIEAGDSTDINGLTTDLNLGAFIANYTKNGAGVDIINYGEGDGGYVQTRWTGGGGIGLNFWQGYNTGAGNTVTGQAINIERYGVGEALRLIAKAGSSTSPLMYSVVEATVNTPVWSVLDNGITSADSVAWTSTAKTTGNLLNFYHANSAWSAGYGLLMNFGDGSGSFGGKFLGLLKAGIEKFSVDDDGTTTAPIRDKGGQVFNVMAYGAVGNGVADDAPAFQAAIDAALAVGGTVFIPPPAVWWSLQTGVVIEPPSGTQAYLNVVSYSPVNLVRWDGGSNTSIFIIRGLKFSRIDGLMVQVVNQNNVIVFDLLNDGTAESLAQIEWRNCTATLGTGRACVGWRMGADAGVAGLHDMSYLSFASCRVYGTDKADGSIGWQNLNNNNLVDVWTNCEGIDLGWFYAGTSLVTILNGAINSSVTTITLDSTIGFAPTGRVRIDTEQISYTGISGSQLTGCTRGAGGSTAASHADNAVVYQGIQNPLDSTWAYDLIGGGEHTFTGCGGALNGCEYLTRRGTFVVDGGRFEQGARLFHAGYGGGAVIQATFRGIGYHVNALPADDIIVAISQPGIYTFDTCTFYGDDHTAAMITAGTIDTAFVPLPDPGSKGRIAINNLAVQGTGNQVWTVPSTWDVPSPSGVRVDTDLEPVGWIYDPVADEILVSPQEMDIATGTPALATVSSFVRVWSIPDGSTSVLTFQITAPPAWDACEVYALWANGSAGTGNVYWLIYGEEFSTGDLLTEAASLTDGVIPTAAAQNVVTRTRINPNATLPVTEAGVQVFHLVRVGGDALDTLAGAVLLLGMIIRRVG